MDPGWPVAVAVASVLLVAALAVMFRAQRRRLRRQREADTLYQRRVETTHSLALKVNEQLREHPSRPLARADAFSIARALSEIGFVAMQIEWWPGLRLWSQIPEDGQWPKSSLTS